MALVTSTPSGLHCAIGQFHIDPSAPVEVAVLTHAHADHARAQMAQKYICTNDSIALLHKRLGADAPLEGHAYGERFSLGDAIVSLHPAGHVLGSAQVRIAARGEVDVVSGDYKRSPDPTTAPCEVIPCDVFVTEATFALPVYRWDAPSVIAREILEWWDEGVRAQRPSVLFCYSLGKAQRILGELAQLCNRRVLVHGATEAVTAIYRAQGIAMLPTEIVSDKMRGSAFAGELVLAPPGAMATPWMRRFGAKVETGFASGWMRVRGARRRRGVDRGFVLSDHADWPELLDTIAATGAREVLTTHGFKEALARFLVEDGRVERAGVLTTDFAGEGDV